MSERDVRIELGPRSYDIRIAPNLIDGVGALIRQRLPGADLGVLTDETVWRLHGQALVRSLAAAGYKAPVAGIAPGEPSKNLDTIAQLYERCLDWRLRRKDAILAFGGGVVGDIAGFVAATYLRGIAVFQVRLVAANGGDVAVVVVEAH